MIGAIVFTLMSTWKTGRRVLGAIGRLRAEGFAPLGGRPAPRGLYLLYEDWLIETLGEEEWAEATK